MSCDSRNLPAGKAGKGCDGSGWGPELGGWSRWGHERNGATEGGDMGRRAPFGALPGQTHLEEDSGEGPSVFGYAGFQESVGDPDPTGRGEKTVRVRRSGQRVRQQGRDR